MVFVVPTHPVTIMLSKLKRILPHWLLEKSRREMMKQLLQANFFPFQGRFIGLVFHTLARKRKNPTWKRDGLRLYFTSASGVGWFPANTYWCAGTSGKTDFYSCFFTPAWQYYLTRAQIPYSTLLFPFPGETSPPPLCEFFQQLYPLEIFYWSLGTHPPQAMLLWGSSSTQMRNWSCSAPDGNQLPLLLDLFLAQGCL